MLQFGDYQFRSRLIVGTGRYPSVDILEKAIGESGADLVTVAIRRVDLADSGQGSILGALQRLKVSILPNTAGCYTAKDAILTAQLGREALGTALVKLEVIGDEKTLYPDGPALLEATAALIKDGFTVLPYTHDDPVLCKRLAELGCPAVMPLGAPIGSGLGIRNPYSLRIIRETCGVPVIVDAGVGTASDASLAMELGCDAVLMNSAIAGARDPVMMARAMKLAVESGRLAYEAGRITMKLHATASSPIEGIVGR